MRVGKEMRREIGDFSLSFSQRWALGGRESNGCGTHNTAEMFTLWEKI